MEPNGGGGRKEESGRIRLDTSREVKNSAFSWDQPTNKLAELQLKERFRGLKPTGSILSSSSSSRGQAIGFVADETTIGFLNDKWTVVSFTYNRFARLGGRKMEWQYQRRNAKLLRCDQN